MVCKQDADKALKAHSVFGHHPLRPWFRAQYGVALTLRKMGRYAEAVQEWVVLRDMDPEWHGMTSSYINVYALAPETVMRYVSVALAVHACT